MPKSKQNDDLDGRYVPIVKRGNTKPASSVGPPKEPAKMSYHELNKQMFNFFRDKDYESYESFKEGHNKVVSEDYKSIELLCNLNTMINECMSDKNTTPQDMQQLQHILRSIEHANKSLKRYDVDMNRVFVAKLTGYILKLLRNYFHD